jgi:hypothetical protein
MSPEETTKHRAKFNLRTVFFSVSALAACMGAGVVFCWHVQATLLFIVGVQVIWLATSRRFEHWRTAIVVGSLVCLLGMATWLWAPDVVGDLQRSKQNLEQLKKELLDAQQQP